MGPCGFSSSSQRWAGAWGILHSPTGKLCSWGQPVSSPFSPFSPCGPLCPCRPGGPIGPGSPEGMRTPSLPLRMTGPRPVTGQGKTKFVLGPRSWRCHLPCKQPCASYLWTQCCTLGITGLERERMASLTFGSGITPLPLFTRWPLDGTIFWRETWRRWWMSGTNYLQKPLCSPRAAAHHTGRTLR